MKKHTPSLAIITTHPIQYNAPWFRLLAERNVIQVKVFYTWSQVEHEEKFDPGFGKNIEWDIPLLEGYNFSFVKNVSKQPGSKNYSGIDNPTLVDEVRSWHPDAVLVFGWRFKSHLGAIKYFKNKIPVLFRGDSTTLDDRNGFRDWLRYRVLRRIYKNIDFALFTGSENKKYFLRSGLTESQLIYVPHAVDNTWFREHCNRIDFRRQLGIPNDEIVFLFAGKLEAKKNPGLLATSFLDMNLSGTHLVFVGNGPLEMDLKSKFTNPRIHFIDFQNQQLMPSVYKMADVFVLPSQGPGETWGLAVNEAMASGRAVLVSDKCGCAIDLVDNYKTGFIFRSDCIGDIQEQMKRLAADKNQLGSMGACANKKILDWSFEKIVIVVEDLVVNYTSK